MVDDNPQDLVHDVVAEAVFGGHPLGPARDRARATVIASVSRDERSRRYHQGRLRRRGNIVVAGAGNLEHEQLPRAPRPRGGRARLRRRADPAAAPRARTGRPPPGLRFRAGRIIEQYHVCVGAPGIARSRPPTVRRLDPRRDPRRLGLVTALPGDPREAWHGLHRLQLRLAVLRHRPRGRLRGHARGEPRGLLSRSSPSELADIGAGNVTEAGSSSGRRRTSRVG